MINETLKYALIPLNINDDKEANLDLLERMIDTLPADVDLVVLPELFTTGFVDDKERLVQQSESLMGDTVARLHRLASTRNVAICGSFLARVGGQLYNRGFIIEPNGDEAFYDKAHLFSVSREGEMLHAGSRHYPIVRFRGWNVAIAVCYDLRFPVWMRNVDNAYDVMIVCANWPDARRHAWDTLISARAIENQAYYLGCDRSGEDPFGQYPAAMTYAVDFKGERCEATVTDQGILVGELHKAPLEKYRERFPVWRDADRFTLM